MVKFSEVPAGALLVCEIFHLFEHSGIYIGEGQIVELQGSGLVRSVSVRRFLADRSGEELLVACDQTGRPLGNPAAQQRAIQQIFTYQPYDLIRNNCHRFCVQCLTGTAWPVTSFFDLKLQLQQLLHQPLRFEKVWLEQL